MQNEAAPIVTRFQIVDLHGYKDIQLDFQHKTKIAIAENGAGKTIFLSILYAFLTQNFEKLSNIEFTRIECDLLGRSNPLILHKNKLPIISDEAKNILREFTRYSGPDVSEIRNEISHYEGGDFQPFPNLHRVYLNSPWDFEETAARALNLRSALDNAQSDYMKDIVSTLKRALGEMQILYLPTYRRIELALSKRDTRRLARRAPLSHASSSLDEKIQSTLGIHYGLADVEQRLRDITQSIQIRSNIGYREISAAIIDDLLAERFASGDWQSEPLPEINSLRLFFSRIEKSSEDAERRLEAISKFYADGRIEKSTNDPLRYFLTKLSRVVNQTKELESNIKNFVEISNEYLGRSGDKKALIYDAMKMKVKVINNWTNSEIGFDDLSSGEKQVISLFAHLYLYQKHKIILIDEPELSLSIEWQKKILPDVVRVPTCRQLIAITHSPFIFENELDPYAGSLEISRHKIEKTAP